jgi:hypothetical protein
MWRNAGREKQRPSPETCKVFTYNNIKNGGINMKDVKINGLEMDTQEAKRYLSSLVEKFELASVKICSSSIHIMTVEGWQLFIICKNEDVGTTIKCHFLMEWHKHLNR